MDGQYARMLQSMLHKTPLRPAIVAGDAVCTALTLWAASTESEREEWAAFYDDQQDPAKISLLLGHGADLATDRISRNIDFATLHAVRFTACRRH